MTLECENRHSVRWESELDWKAFTCFTWAPLVWKEVNTQSLNSDLNLNKRNTFGSSSAHKRLKRKRLSLCAQSQVKSHHFKCIARKIINSLATTSDLQRLLVGGRSDCIWLVGFRLCQVVAKFRRLDVRVYCISKSLVALCTTLT